MKCSRQITSRPAAVHHHVAATPGHRGPTSHTHVAPRLATIPAATMVNPTTGEEYTVSDAALKKPNQSIEVDGINLAVRATKQYTEGATDKPTVLFVHGLAYNSYCFRYLMDSLERDGWPCVAFDWPGHGSSDKPPPSKFPYTEDAYYQLFEKAVDKLLPNKPFHMVCQGYILSQIGLLYPIRNPDNVERITLHSVPLDTKAKLREEFQAYFSPLPFLRPKNPIDGNMFMINGSQYVLMKSDGRVYFDPLQTPEGDLAVTTTLSNVDFPLLLRKVDEGFKTWRKPAIIVNGNKDIHIPIDDAVNWLQTKRTCMKYHYLEVPCGHVPFEEVPENLYQVYKVFLNGELDRAMTQDDLQMIIPNPQGREIRKMWDNMPAP